MTQELKLVSPICPSVNHYLGYRVVKKRVGNKWVQMPMCYKKPEAVRYQKKFAEYIKEQIKIQDWKKIEDKFKHCYFDCVFYFERTDQDGNNYFKCMLDAVTDSKVVWEDDTQCCERIQGIYYDKDNPRIEITIRPVDYIGIFNNEKELNIFEDKCKTCTRHKRNCSILRKAKEGRIQKEIKNLECEKFKGIKGE